MRVDLTDEAIRLGRLLRALLPDDGEVAGLLALMLLTDARRPARVSRTGELVTLDEQDRAAWDRALIAEGAALVRERIEAVAAGGEPPGRYQLQAAISAVHTEAPSARDTNWSAIVALYGRLVLLDPSPIVRLNRAVAVAEVDGPGAGLAEIDRLAEVLDGYHAFHASPRRPAAAARARRRVPGGLRPGHRACRQPRGTRVPHPQPRPARHLRGCHCAVGGFAFCG